jgi:hypothetical protein
MRLAAGGSIVAHGLMRLATVLPALLFIPEALGIAAGILLLAGLWTPIAGSLVVALEIWHSLTEQGNLWVNMLLGTIGIGLALLGPGGWSVDARLFGWKRIDVRRMKNPDDRP